MNILRRGITIGLANNFNAVPSVSRYRASHDEAGAKDDLPKVNESKRIAEFRKKLRETTPITDLGEQATVTKADDPLPAFPNNTNPSTGEVGGPRGPEPTRYGDWERKGRVTDF